MRWSVLADRSVCRVTRDGFAGAVAGNPFGGYATADPLTRDGLRAAQSVRQRRDSRRPRKAYAFGFLDEILDYKQQVVAANVSGDVCSRASAPDAFQGAVGAEYRIEEGENIGTPAGARRTTCAPTT